MKHKSRKKAAMILLSLMLATTGCKSEGVDIKEGYQESLEDYFDKNYHYRGNSIFNINKDNYKEFYYNFFCTAIDNMTDEEYKEFSREFKRMSNYEYSIESLLYYTNKMLPYDNKEFGHAFFSIFCHQLQDDEVGALWYTQNETFSHINTLRTIINNDEEFFSSVFSRDINEVIDCICQNTNIKDRTLVEELILKLDQYYEIYNDSDYQSQKLAVMYETRIQEIMNTLVQTKCATDSNFNQTLYATMLKESKYFDKDRVTIYQELLGLNAGFYDENYGVFPYSINIPYQYLLSDTSIEEVKSRAVEREISIFFDEDTEDYEKQPFNMLVLLLDSNALGESGSGKKGSTEMRKLIYENLKSHFASEEKFNEFFLSFIQNNSTSQDFYMHLFNACLLDDGITFYDFIRYSALTNYVDESTITHYRERETDIINFQIDVTYGDLVKMTKEEYEQYVHTYYENWLFNYDVDYQKYIDEGAQILANNDLGFEAIYNPDCSIRWDYGYLSPYYVSPLVISDTVKPQEGKYNGADVIYYEYPEFYEDGEAIETFINIENSFTKRTIPGFKAEITDSKTGEIKSIYIVSIGGNLEEYGDARFGTFYYNFNKQKDAKSLRYGGNYE